MSETNPEVSAIIKTLVDRALSHLSQSQVSKIREASAELNGIYGLYQEQLAQGKQDIHWLIATDTAQGRATAEIVEKFLRSQSLPNINTYIPAGLSMASPSLFSDGIDQLITWMQENIPDLQKNGYKIYFNLVGSFKSLQGYLNTIGMFYADEIIYIFEGHKSELITIPRLPIQVDTKALTPYNLQLALMNEGAVVKTNEVLGIPEALVYVSEDEVTLSNWGKLLWGECREELLSQELLPFPHLRYRQSFVDDYQRIKDKGERLKLQETLAKVSQLLLKSNGDTRPLRGGAIQYTRYKNSDKIDHFRVNLSQRVSCETVEGNLLLRFYGDHDYVEGRELA